MLVYICCAGGATSSLFCKKISDAASKSVFVDHIGIVLPDLDTYLKEYDLVLAYGPVTLLNERNLEKYSLDKILASVWIAPQARYLEKPIRELFAPYNIPVNVVNMRTFGTMNGKQALDDIMANLPD